MGVRSKTKLDEWCAPAAVANGRLVEMKEDAVCVLVREAAARYKRRMQLNPAPPISQGV